MMLKRNMFLCSPLINILVYSLYTKKEIFIRELVSNASDALDKVRYKLLSDKNVIDKDEELKIEIKTDEKKKRLVISDTGIGMSKVEVKDNIGTIAKSGTIEFLSNLTKEKKEDINLIGKFGVGFYSVFMAAKEVKITSRSVKPDFTACLWKSDGAGVRSRARTTTR